MKRPHAVAARSPQQCLSVVAVCQGTRGEEGGWEETRAVRSPVLTSAQPLPCSTPSSVFSLVLIQFFHNVGCLFDSQEISHINKKEAVRDSGVTYRVYSTAAGTSQPSRRRS